MFVCVVSDKRIIHDYHRRYCFRAVSLFYWPLFTIHLLKPEKMKPIIAEQLNVNEAEIKPETKFKDDLGADSLDLFEMVMALEEEFGIEIPSEDLENIVTVNDIMGYLKEKGVEA